MRRSSFQAISGVALAAGMLLAGCDLLNPTQVRDLAQKALSAAQSELGRKLTNQVVETLQSYVDVEAAQTLADSAGGLSALVEGFSVQALPKGIAPVKPGDVKDQLPPELKDKLPALLKDTPPADFLKELNGPPPKIGKAKEKLESALKTKLGDLAQVKPDELKKQYKDIARGKIEQFRKDMAKRVETRLTKIKFDLSKDFQTAQGTASLDPFGEVFFVSATMSLKVKDMARIHTFDRYYIEKDDAKVLVQVVDHVEQTFKNGAVHKADRTRTNYGDGTFEVTFDASTVKGNKTRSVSWVRKGAADGSETGTGTIVRTDGTRTEVTFTKDASGKTVTTTTDADTKTKVEVSQTEGGADASVTISDSADPARKTTMTVNSEDLEPELE